MKKAAILLVAGTVGLVASPAVAGSKKRDIKTKVASVEKTETAAKAAPELPAFAPVAAPAEAPEILAIPELPEDMSSVLAPLPELEAKVAASVAMPRPVMKAHTKKAPVMNMGKDYVLGQRESAKPTGDVEHIIPKSLSQAQVATVVQAHMGEIQSCWAAVPKQLRVDACTADLKLTISDAGAVTDIELGGDVPAAAHKCITAAVSRWSFPVAETSSEVDYGISLRSL